MNLIDKDAIPWAVDGVGEIPVITKEEIEAMPTVDAVPVRHGQWVTCRSSDHWKCSKCGYLAPMWWNGDEDGYIEWLSDYCPNCGARMDDE